MIQSAALETLLAADVGGTKSALGLYGRDGVEPLHTATLATRSIVDLGEAVAAFVAERPARLKAPSLFALGIAGLVEGRVAELTNTPLRIDADALERRLGCAVALANDLVAMGHALPALGRADLEVFQEGVPEPQGNLALVAVGTGVNATLVRCGRDGLEALPGEWGVAGFAPRTRRELDLAVWFLGRGVSHVCTEDVLSGLGLTRIHAFTHREPCRGGGADPPAMSAAAKARSCPGCVEALSLFGEALGAECGNVALRLLPRGGLFVGGGAARGALGAIDRAAFLAAFRDKPPMQDRMARVPVAVIRRGDSGLLGAAQYARQLLQRRA